VSSSDAMDRYLKKPVQKTESAFLQVLSELGPAVCVIGKTGIGKTHAIRAALNPRVEITSEMLKSKQDTLDFLNKIDGTNLHVFIDEYECVCELVGLREITKPPTTGLLVIASQILVKMDMALNIYEFPVPTAEQLKAIAPGASDDVIAESAGDVRWVLQSLNFKSEFKDDFKSPREFLTSLVSRVSTVNPVAFIGQPASEPGNMVSILNANYTDSPKIDHAKVADLFSMADVIEEKVYSGVWELMPYFNLLGCILPAVEIGHTLSSNLKPGVTWTKYQNMCMRRKRIKSMFERVQGRNLDMDAALLIRSMIEKNEAEAIELMKEYGFQKEDVDILNHLSYTNKIKAKTVSQIKKCVSAAQNQSKSS